MVARGVMVALRLNLPTSDRQQNISRNCISWSFSIFDLSLFSCASASIVDTFHRIMKATAASSLLLCLLPAGYGFISHAPALRVSSLYKDCHSNALSRPQHVGGQRVGAAPRMAWGDDVVWSKVCCVLWCFCGKMMGINIYSSVAGVWAIHTFMWWNVLRAPEEKAA